MRDRRATREAYKQSKTGVLGGRVRVREKKITGKRKGGLCDSEMWTGRNQEMGGREVKRGG